MKERSLILLAFLAAITCFSQSYDTIRIGQNTSVNMIFDSPVQKWDMGLGMRTENGIVLTDVLVDNPMSSPNRIKLAASIPHFQTTNLFVETEMGYYNFILSYDPEPKHLLIKVDARKATILKTPVPPSNNKNTESVADVSEEMHSFCEKILVKNDVTDIGEEKQDMLFYIGGIYIAQDLLFIKININNKGNIPFDLGYIGFFTGSKGKGGNKRKPRQLTPLQPKYANKQNEKSVGPGESIALIYVFDQFTLDTKHKLFIQIWEGNNGERKVELVAGSKDVLKAIHVN